MSSSVAVSVVMPIYNAEKYLKEAMDSVLGQTLHNIEIICVNDGSKDSSLQIINEYARRDSRISVIDKPNGGYGCAMNTGIENASGEYIGILEPDDYLKATMYETLYKAAKTNQLDFVRSNYYRLTTDKEGIDHLAETKISPKSEYYNVVLNPAENLDLFNVRMENWTGLFKREFIQKFDIRFNESPGAAFQDNGFWFQSYCHAHRIMLINEAFYCYRIDNAASSINQTDKVFVMLDEYKWIEDWLRSKPELYSRFIGIFHYKKTHNCEFALSRLASNFKLDFLERYASEFQHAFEAGEVDEALFWPDEIERLKGYMRDPEAELKRQEKLASDLRDLETARMNGRIAVFKFYQKHEGCYSAIRRALKSVLR